MFIYLVVFSWRSNMDLLSSSVPLLSYTAIKHVKFLNFKCFLSFMFLHRVENFEDNRWIFFVETFTQILLDISAGD